MSTESNGKISTVIFDIGNVILLFDYMRAARKFSDLSGLPLETIEKHFYFSELERLYSKGKVSSEDFYQTLKKDLDLQMDFETFARIWNDIFWLNHAVAELIEKLKGKYRLVAITNTTDLHFRYWLENFQVFEYIEVFFPSHELGMRKPDPELFKTVLGQLKVRPDEVVFIDDLEANVKAAEALGMNAVQYKEPERLLEALKGHGVKI